jgi:enoyl-CoA hydratase/carnithine racemase
LPPRVGYARATSAILTGGNQSSSDWRRAGLIEVVAPADALDDAVANWFATHLAPKSASSLRHAAAAARTGLLAHVRHTLPALERLYLDDLMHTADAVEGIEAFMQKRVPRWRDA